MDYPENTPTSLIAQCKNHDPKGWERVKLLYEKLVLYWCQKLNVPKNDLQDVFQDVILKAMSSIDSFKKEKPGDSFRGWLRRVTYSRIMDYYRAQQKLPKLWDMCNVPSESSARNSGNPDALLDQLSYVTPEEETTELSIVHNALREEMYRTFDEKSIQAFELMAFHQWTSREVAEKLGMTPTAVRQAKFRIIRWAQLSLDEGNDEEPDSEESQE